MKELVARLGAIRWSAAPDAERTRARLSLMKEHLRRSALWSEALGCPNAWPFFDVAAKLAGDRAPVVRAGVERPASPEVVRRSIDWMLRYAALPASERRADLPDPYEALLAFYEQGGAFRTEAKFVQVELAGIPYHDRSAYLRDEPFTAITAPAPAPIAVPVPVAEDGEVPQSWPEIFAARAGLIADTLVSTDLQDNEDDADLAQCYLLQGAADVAFLGLLDHEDAGDFARAQKAAVQAVASARTEAPAEVFDELLELACWREAARCFLDVPPAPEDVRVLEALAAELPEVGAFSIARLTLLLRGAGRRDLAAPIHPLARERKPKLWDEWYAVLADASADAVTTFVRTYPARANVPIWSDLVLAARAHLGPEASGPAVLAWLRARVVGRPG